MPGDKIAGSTFGQLNLALQGGSLWCGEEAVSPRRPLMSQGSEVFSQRHCVGRGSSDDFNWDSFMLLQSNQFGRDDHTVKKSA